MTENSEQRQPSGAEWIVSDERGHSFRVPVAPGRDAIDVEAEVRERGWRTRFLYLLGDRQILPKGVTAAEFARFNEMLASAVGRDIPLSEGVRNLARDMRAGRFARSLERVAGNLERGMSLREAFAPERGGFPPLYGRLIEGGAAAGGLSQVLLAIGRNVRSNAAFRRAAVDALVYPVFLLAACLGMLGFFAQFIFPRYDDVARQVGMAYSPTAEWFLAFVACGALTAAPGLIGVALVALATLDNDRLWGHWPVLRSLREAILWANAGDILAMFFRAGTPAPAAWRMVGLSLDHDRFSRTCDEVAAEVEKGHSQREAVRCRPEVPLAVLRAVESGERRQDMAAAFEQLGQDYRIESQRLCLSIARYLPPLLAVFMGLVVFAMGVVVLGPFFRMWGAGW